MKNTRNLLKQFYPKSASRNALRLRLRKKQTHDQKKKLLQWSNKRKKRPGLRSKLSLGSKPLQMPQRTPHRLPNQPLPPLKTSKQWSKKRLKRPPRKQESSRKRQKKRPKNNFESKSMKVQWQKSKMPVRLRKKRSPALRRRQKHRLLL